MVGDIFFFLQNQELEILGFNFMWVWCLVFFLSMQGIERMGKEKRKVEMEYRDIQGLQEFCKLYVFNFFSLILKFNGQWYI